MKLILCLILSAAAVLVHASVENLEINKVNGKVFNWSGTIDLDPSGAMIFTKSGISYSRCKYSSEDSRFAEIRFSGIFAGASIGLYFYDKNGVLCGEVSDRIPNSEVKRDYTVVFVIPEKMKNKNVAMVRIFFRSGSVFKLNQITMNLKKGK